MDWLKQIKETLKPESFRKDPYLWLLNQWGHVSLSGFLAYYLSLVTPYFWLIIISLWIAWEVKQLIQSKDIKDFLEDLLFEAVGVFVAFNFFWFIPIAGALLITIFLIKIKRNYDKINS